MCPHCDGTGCILIFDQLTSIPELIECGYCTGTGEAKGD